LVGHVYSLVPLAMADHRPAWQIIVWQSCFRRNRLNAQVQAHLLKVNVHVTENVV